MAGLLSALRAKGLDAKALGEQRIAVLGAGSAGLGVVDSLIRGRRAEDRQ